MTSTASLQDQRQQTDYQALAKQYGTPLLVLDCDVLRTQYRALRQALPNVELHHAIKAWPQRDVIRTLAEEGACFDIASSGEIELLREENIFPGRTIHTHPIKTKAEIEAALRFGCTTFVFDNPAELEKLRPYRHRVGLLLRVGYRNTQAQCDLASKFGCPPEQAEALIEQAQRSGLHVKGISFHVGSQTPDATAHVAAIEHANELIERSHQRGIAPMSVLDIGGGFPVSYRETLPGIEAFCEPIRAALAKVQPDIRIIAEPGRFLVAPAATAVSRVVGLAERLGKTWYYLDDGVYNSYSGLIYDHASYPIETLRDGPTTSCVLAGPTCDSIDVIASDIQLPKLDIGDLILARQMGAYSAASATTFNSLPVANVVPLNDHRAQKFNDQYKSNPF